MTLIELLKVLPSTAKVRVKDKLTDSEISLQEGLTKEIVRVDVVDKDKLTVSVS